MIFKDYEIDLLIETIEYRLENDSQMIYQDTLKEELKDLLGKIEENEDWLDNIDSQCYNWFVL